MNVKKNYKKGTRREIIELLHMCGVIPEKSLRYLNGKNYKVMRMKISEMIKEGVVKYVKRGRLPRILMLEESKREEAGYSDSLPPELLSYYEEYVKKADIKRFLYSGKKEKGLPNENGEKTEKVYVNDSEAHRIFLNSDTMLFMYGCGIQTLATIKEDKDYRAIRPVYYNAREIKNKVDYKADIETRDGEVKLNYSRIRGLLISDGGIYAVYRASTRATYKQSGEYKMKFYLDRLVNKKVERGKEVTEAVFIADDNASEIVKNILVPKEGEKKFLFTSMEFVYKRIYSLPPDVNGQKLLKVFTHHDWQKKILQSFELPRVPEMEGVVCDGYDGKTYYYVFCIPDIKRFKKFIARAEIENDKKKYVVICFDWQVPLMKKTIGLYATIKKVPFEKYITEMKF